MGRCSWFVRGILGIALLSASGSESPAAGLSVEIRSGRPFHFGSTLRIAQTGHPGLEHDAAWASEAWTPPIYWALRVAREVPGGDWAIELMHDKVVLDPPPDEIGSFSISHGCNLLTAQRSWGPPRSRLRAGLGLVLAHPENEVRGGRLPENRGIANAGYYLTGPVGLIGAATEQGIGKRIAVTGEARFSLACVTVPVARGEADLLVGTCHLLVGLRWGFR